jgi:predicted transcriptional regulator
MVSIRDIITTEHILESSENDSLSKALSKLPTSHSATFICSEDKKKVGLVNPYHCIIRNSLPGNAKVEACIFHPQRLYVNTPINKVIESFISSKIHYMPIFNRNETFAGVVSSRRVLDALKDMSYFNVSIAEVLQKKNKPLITIKDTDILSTAIHLFKFHKVSKLIVVNKDNKLKGVLSYYDLIHFMMSPKHKLGSGDKEGKKSSILNQKVTNFSKTFVLTLSKKDSMRQALLLVLEKKIGSVIIIDSEKHPIGIVTTRDFFNIVLRPTMGSQIFLFTKNLSRSSTDVVQGFYSSFQAFLKNQRDLSRAKLLVKEEKQGGLFKVLLSILPTKGKEAVIKKEGRDLKLVLQEVKDNARSLHDKQQSTKQ